MLVKGVVVAGRKLGRKLGFPTANISALLSDDLENGVYISTAIIDGKSWISISNVGNKPTIGCCPRNLECHILDFDGDLYGQTIEVELIEKLRDEQRFSSLDELEMQVKLDIERVRNLKNRI